MKQYNIIQINGWSNICNLSGDYETIKKQYELENKYNVYPVTNIIDLESGIDVMKETIIKQPKIKTNKTAIQNSLKYIPAEYKEMSEFKDIAHIRRVLLNRNINEDMESIEYNYNRLIDLYCLSAKGFKHWYIQTFLKATIKLIYNSDVNINSYNKEYLNYLNKYNLI